MPLLKIRETKIYYRWEGKKKDPQLVFVHGWAASSEWWVRQIPTLSKTHRLLLIDLPGHGQSGNLPRHSNLKSLSSVLDSVITTLGVEDPGVVGWSLGGMVALQYVLDHPHSVSALILVDTAPTARVMPSLGFLPTIPYYWIPDPRRVLPLIKLSVLFSEGSFSVINHMYIRRGVAALLVHLLATGKKPDRRLVSWCTSILLKELDLKALLQIVVAMIEFDVADRLSEITAPTLILHGREDRMMPVDFAELLHHQIRDSKLRVIEGAGHCPHLEKPREFNRTILAFLRQLHRMDVFTRKSVFAQWRSV